MLWGPPMPDNPIFAPDVMAQQQQIARQQAIAQALQEQGMQNTGNTQMAGGVAIRNSPLTGLANMLASYEGAKIGKSADAANVQVNQQRQQAMAEALKSGLGQLQSDPSAGITTLASNLDTARYAQALAPEIYKPKTEKEGSAQIQLLHSMGYKENTPEWNAKANEMYGGGPSDYQNRLLDTQNRRLDLMEKNASGKGGALDADTIDFAADQYLKTGVMPALGMGSASTRTAILGAAAKKAKEQGMSGGDAAVAQADYKAGAGSLAQLTKQSNAIEWSENTAAKNADLALSLAGKGGGNSGVPVLNRWIQAGRKHIAGDADVASYDTALTTFKNEYAKVMSGATGAAGSTDASRHEADELISSAYTPEMLQRTIETMKLDMGNRSQTARDELESVKGKMKGGKKPVATTPTASGWGIQEIK